MGGVHQDGTKHMELLTNHNAQGAQKRHEFCQRTH